MIGFHVAEQPLTLLGRYDVIGFDGLVLGTGRELLQEQIELAIPSCRARCRFAQAQRRAADLDAGRIADRRVAARLTAACNCRWRP